MGKLSLAHKINTAMETPVEGSLPLAPDALSLPILYLDNEELQSFLSSDSATAMGIAYEWEGEKVVHLHLNPVDHAFGTQHKVLFVKSEVADKGDADYVVIVSADAEPRVLMSDGDGFKEHPASLIPARSELFSRSKGILEVGALAGKRVMIVGLGSFGSQIAIELAKAGVGSFALMDFDRVELHNLMRHSCVLNELGRLKTDAIRDAILGKNPYAEVDRFPININRHLDLMASEVRKADIVICATDNNESRFNLSRTLVEQGRIGIFGRAVTRAEGGDVFIYRPGEACYCCLIGNGWFGQADEEITDEASARRDGRIASYVSAKDADAVVQVGLSSDIEPICNMMVKLTLLELSRGIDTGISSLENELVYNYYMWANRRERRHANWSPLPSAGAMPTIMRWYGAHIKRDEDCALCALDMRLDITAPDEDLALLDKIIGMSEEQ